MLCNSRVENKQTFMQLFLYVRLKFISQCSSFLPTLKQEKSSQTRNSLVPRVFPLSMAKKCSRVWGRLFVNHNSRLSMSNTVLVGCTHAVFKWCSGDRHRIVVFLGVYSIHSHADSTDLRSWIHGPSSRNKYWRKTFTTSFPLRSALALLVFTSNV